MVDDLRLIELVSQNGVLYDLSHPKYRDSTHKLCIWYDIGDKMNADVSLCKSRWYNIRDNYRKSLKKIESKGKQAKGKITHYKYSDLLTFLRPHFDDMDIRGDIESEEHSSQGFDKNLVLEDSMKIESADEEEYNIIEMNEEALGQLVTPTNFKNMQRKVLQSASHEREDVQHEIPNRKSISTRKLVKRKLVAQQTGQSKLMKNSIRNIENSSSKPILQHPVDIFLASIGSTLKAFNPYYLNLAKSEIFATVQKYEMKMLIDQDSRQNISNQDFSQNLILQNFIRYKGSPSGVSDSLLSTETFLDDKKIEDDGSDPCENITNNTTM